MRKGLLALVLLLAGAATRPLEVAASLGAGVGAAPITLAEPARPGHTYELPSLFVINTGTETSFYDVKVERFSNDSEKVVPPAWVHFALNHFQLAPQRSMAVGISLAVPADAADGAYRTHLVAGTAPASSSGGVAFGAAAATKLLFTVARPTGLGIPAVPWWAYLLAAAAVLALGSVVMLRRLGIRIQVERRG